MHDLRLFPSSQRVDSELVLLPHPSVSARYPPCGARTMVKPVSPSRGVSGWTPNEWICVGGGAKQVGSALGSPRRKERSPGDKKGG